MNLYIDIGNTNIKLNYQNQLYLMSAKKKYTLTSFWQAIAPKIKKGNFDYIYICSVVPNILKLIEVINEKYWQKKLHLLAYTSLPDLKIKTKTANTIGNDLIALAFFASNKASNSIIVNMGTATTITHVKNRIIKGVIIIPGLQTSWEALINDAAGLKMTKLEMPNHKKVGNNTIEAISLGIIKGAVHLINGFVKEIDLNADLILSGGNAPIVQKYLPQFQYYPEATIAGLKEFAKKS